MNRDHDEAAEVETYVVRIYRRARAPASQTALAGLVEYPATGMCRSFNDLAELWAALTPADGTRR